MFQFQYLRKPCPGSRFAHSWRMCMAWISPKNCPAGNDGGTSTPQNAIALPYSHDLTAVRDRPMPCQELAAMPARTRARSQVPTWSWSASRDRAGALERPKGVNTTYSGKQGDIAAIAEPCLYRLCHPARIFGSGGMGSPFACARFTFWS